MFSSAATVIGVLAFVVSGPLLNTATGSGRPERLFFFFFMF